MVTMDFYPQLIPFSKSERISRPGGKGVVLYAALKTVNNYMIKCKVKWKKSR